MQHNTKIWVNGQATTQLSVYDRGFQFGDGVFETMRVKNGNVILWDAHLARLQKGCQRLDIHIALEEIQQQRDTIMPQLADGILKLIVSRGAGGRGYRTNAETKPTIVWMFTESAIYPSSYYSDGVDVFVCKTTVNRNPLLAGIKHLNRLENVLARQEWGDDFQEGLMCDERGNIIEGTMSNFFAIKNDMLVTPDLSASGVEGIMRQQILKLAGELGLAIDVRDIPVTEIADIEAAMLTNSLLGIWPVKSIAGRALHVSPIYSRLVDELPAYLK